MQQILSSNPIKDGIHTMKVQSVNDMGGFTVIGISNGKFSDYYQCLGIAGNNFTTNFKNK